MAKCSVLKLLGAWLLTLVSCSTGGEKFAKSIENSPSRPSIYDAWDARYDYDANARRMVPLYKGKVVGKSWARDSDGQLSAASYTGRSKEVDEDLLHSTLESSTTNERKFGKVIRSRGSKKLEKC